MLAGVALSAQHEELASQQTLTTAQQSALAVFAVGRDAPATQHASHTEQHSRQSVEHAGQGTVQQSGFAAASVAQQPPVFATGQPVNGQVSDELR